MPEPTQDAGHARVSQHVIIDADRFELLFSSLLDRLEALEQRAPTPEMIAEAMNLGVGRAASNPENWCRAASGLRAATERQAGPWLIRGGAWRMFKWAAAFAMLLFVLATGGPTAAWAMVKSWFGSAA